MTKISTDELSTLAYKKVRAMIISKKLVPGQKIVQDKLAEKLGISRTPLRSALQMLEGEHLVQSLPRRGMIVKELNDSEILEIYDCRMALEQTAISLFTNRAAAVEINYLRTLFEPFQQGSIDALAYQKADSKFHETIVKGCGNGFLYRLFQQGNLLAFIEIIGLVRPPEETLEEHNAIIDAIEKRDTKTAERLASIHLDRSKQLVMERLKE